METTPKQLQRCNKHILVSFDGKGNLMISNKQLCSNKIPVHSAVQRIRNNWLRQGAANMKPTLLIT